MGHGKRLWFLEPLNAHTNGVFSRELDAEESPREIRGYRRKEPFFVWQCTEREKDFFVQSRTAGLSFNLWSSLGDNPPRLVPFDEDKRKRIDCVRKKAEKIKKSLARR